MYQYDMCYRVYVYVIYAHHSREARVWFTGAPKHAYQALDETIETE